MQFPQTMKVGVVAVEETTVTVLTFDTPTRGSRFVELPMEEGEADAFRTQIGQVVEIEEV